MNTDYSHGHCPLVLFPQHALISSDTELSKRTLHLPVPEHMTRALLFEELLSFWPAALWLSCLHTAQMSVHGGTLEGPQSSQNIPLMSGQGPCVSAAL